MINFFTNENTSFFHEKVKNSNLAQPEGPSGLLIKQLMST